MTQQEFVAYIDERVKAAGKLEDVANDLGVSRTTLYNWMNGEKPSRMAIAMVAKIVSRLESE